ncbi:MAG: DUF2071 domain-containing protein [Akkermansiaceae bacterium]
MKIPAIKGVIRRRLLLNYRVSPEIVQSHLPKNFRPKLVNGQAIAGICLIRLEQVRPTFLPAFTGISSENSAHRVAVEWDDKNGLKKEGVFVPRRDTDSLLNSLAGGRIFPGVHHHSRFEVTDQKGEISIMISSDDKPLVEVQAKECESFPEKSIFGSFQESSRFFENGCIGYSSRPHSARLDGLRLNVPNWQASPLKVLEIKSSYFDNSDLFPPGTITFDHGLLMRDIPHEWHSEPELNA